MTTSVRPVAVCRSDEVPERGRLVLDVGERTIGVFRLADQLYAYDNTCPHMGGPVCQGLLISGVREKLDDKGVTLGQVFDDDDLHVVCPWHGFEYSIESGRHAGTGSPRLRSFPVTERGGVVYVDF